MQKNSFVLQTRLNAIVSKLSDKQAGILFKSILNYATNGIKANLEDGMVDVVFEMVKQDIDYNANKYAETCAKRAMAGTLGGRPKKANESKCFSKKAKKANGFFEKHNDVDNDVDNDIDKTTITPLPPLKGKEQLEFVSDQFKPIFNRWLDYKKEKKQTYKSKLSLQQCYKQLLEYANNDVVVAEKIVNQSIANNWAGLFPLKETKKAVPVNDAVNNILEFMLANYEDKGIAGNPTLKERYVNKWSKTASDLINACGGNVEQAKEMIKLYAKKQTGEWFLWGVLNDYCGLYEELKRRKLCQVA